MEWMSGFFIPLIEIIFIGGIILFVGYFVSRAVYNAWSHQTKFFFKFKIFRRSYPENTLAWCLDCIDQGIGYYDTKKMLMVKMLPDNTINETLWIYDQILDQMKGGLDKHGRGFKASNSKDQGKATEFPTISS
jgi:hypothetical protein